MKSAFLNIKAKFINTVDQWITRIIRGTHDHYFCFLPKRLGTLTYFMLKIFFRGIQMNEEETAKLEQIPDNAVIIYANKFKSYFDFLFYHTRYTEKRLRIPEIGIGYKIRLFQPPTRIIKVFIGQLDHLIRHRSFPNPFERGYFRQELLSNRGAFFSLVSGKGFYRRFVKAETDPIQYLIELQQSIDRPVYIVPHLMFFGKRPIRARASVWDVLFGTELKPGRLRRLITMIRKPGKIFIELSEPLNIQDFISLPENENRSTFHLALVLRRRLLLQFNRHRQSITGPLLKSREEIKESILTNERLRETMVQFAEKRDLPLHKVHKETNSYLDEIAANYNNAVIEFGAIVVKWFLNTMFDGLTVNTDMINRLKNMSQKGPVILIPCHKSHIDYLILSYILYLNNMPCPHVVAGKNLFFWPLGPIFRAGGAFSIRRSFKGAALYSKVFAEYVHKLLEEGFNIELFIEGGRSRTGKLLVPQLGFVSILLSAFKNNACEDLIFAPIYVGYDRVLEEKAYLTEIEGGQKEPENLKQVIKARRFLKKKYGRIYVKFAEPISMREILQQRDIAIETATSKETNELCRYIGNRVINAIGSATVVTPHALVASAALNFAKDRFAHSHIMTQIETYLSYLVSRSIPLSDTLLMDHTQAIETVVEMYIQRKFIERISHENDASDDPLYQVNINQRPNLEYYKNNCISHFVPASYTAFLILEKDAFQFSSSDLHTGYSFLQDLFKQEFSIPHDKTPTLVVRKTIKAFVDDAILMPHSTLPDTYNLTSAGFRKIRLFARLLKPYFESYWVVLNFFMSSPKADIKPKDRIKKIQAKGFKMFKGNEIERKESMSKVNYQNAVDFFTSQGIRGAEDTAKIEPYEKLIQKYLNIMST